jgi:ABC-2 type transport system ATP-binding protein
MPARDLQARLIDADRLIVDAVPKGGAVWFIRQPKVETDVLDGLLGDASATSRARKNSKTLS